jgi:toxin CcdB
MAPYDVHESREGFGYLLNCQSAYLDHLSHRLMVPLLTPDNAPRPRIPRLNPVFIVGGEPLVMMTHFAAATPLSAAGKKVASLAQEHGRIIDAFDMLLIGF